mmetsp:Transcript_4236/g.7771  ORF Transcript_4236/g.7771 Transcript_4236/m.7771 type:complete len:107 (+) Transcript_4236:147-467(+)
MNDEAWQQPSITAPIQTACTVRISYYLYRTVQHVPALVRFFHQNGVGMARRRMARFGRRTLHRRECFVTPRRIKAETSASAAAASAAAAAAGYRSLQRQEAKLNPK